MSRPMVSVITPTFNSSAFVREALQSVCNQTVQDWEHIVVDDCSQDNTREILREKAGSEQRLRLFFLNVNCGPAQARNAGISAARGRYIAFLDSDDLWEPDKLALQLQAMQESGTAFVYGAYYRMVEGSSKKTLIPVPGSIDYQGLLNSTVIATLTAMYDTKKLGRVLMPEIRKRQDYALWLKLLRMTPRAHGVAQPLGTLRKRPGSLSSNKLNSMYYTWRVYRKCESLSMVRSLYHFCNYAWRAFKKSLR